MNAPASITDFAKFFYDPRTTLVVPCGFGKITLTSIVDNAFGLGLAFRLMPDDLTEEAAIARGLTAEDALELTPLNAPTAILKFKDVDAVINLIETMIELIQYGLDLPVNETLPVEEMVDTPVVERTVETAITAEVYADFVGSFDTPLNSDMMQTLYDAANSFHDLPHVKFDPYGPCLNVNYMGIDYAVTPSEANELLTEPDLITSYDLAGWVALTEEALPGETWPDFMARVLGMTPVVNGAAFSYVFGAETKDELACRIDMTLAAYYEWVGSKDRD